MRALTFFPFISALLFASGVAAQPLQQTAIEEPSTAELARQYIDVGGAEDLFVEGAAYGFRQGAEAGGVRFTASQWQRVQIIVREGFRPAGIIFIDELATYVATTASHEDLVAALSYYNTETGRRYVMATVAFSFPLSAYLGSQGRVPLQDAPPANQLDAARLNAAHTVSALLINNLHESERAQIDLTSFGIAGMEDFVARSLARDLQVSELEAARTWLSTPASLRLEGPSAERTLRMQTAGMRAMNSVDMPYLIAQIQAIMREPPPT